jgi:hypothetical protein
MLVALNNTKKNSKDVTWLSSAVLLVLPFYSNADSPQWKDALARYKPSLHINWPQSLNFETPLPTATFCPITRKEAMKCNSL